MPTPAALTPKEPQIHATAVRVVLPDLILEQYERQAAARNIPLDVLISERLGIVVGFTAEKPLYFSDEDRSQLERYLGRNILHTGDALLQIRKSLSIRLHNVAIVLAPGLLQRLKTRCIGMPFEQFIEERVIQALEQYAGMR